MLATCETQTTKTASPRMVKHLQWWYHSSWSYLPKHVLLYGTLFLMQQRTCSLLLMWCRFNCIWLLERRLIFEFNRLSSMVVSIVGALLQYIFPKHVSFGDNGYDCHAANYARLDWCFAFAPLICSSGEAHQASVVGWFSVSQCRHFGDLLFFLLFSGIASPQQLWMC